MAPWKEIEQAISEATNDRFKITSQSSIGGGCINSAYRVSDDKRDYFVKINSADHGEMFAAEADGLNEIANSKSVRVPLPIHTGSADGYTWIVMGLLPLGGSGDMALFGEQLAAMHQTHASQFGWYRDNTIGSTPQPNQNESDWVSFLQKHRYGYQIDLAQRKGASRRLVDGGRELIENMNHFFNGYSPAPSLLHGDLWSGNYAFTRDGDTVIFDPAVYYGDREADIAMTELFGAFGGRFYQGYESVLPLDSGYSVRKTLYNLYHIINHFNMFGGGYESQATGMIERLHSEIR